MGVDFSSGNKGSKFARVKNKKVYKQSILHLANQSFKIKEN